MTKMNPDLDAWMSDHGGLACAASLMAIIPLCMVACCKNLARTVPYNYMLLSTFTSLETFFFMFVASMYQSQSVITAAGMTLVMTLAITAYSIKTKTDFTAMSGLMLCLSVGMLLLIVCSSVFSYIEWWHPVVATMMVVMYGLYLIYDT